MRHSEPLSLGVQQKSRGRHEGHHALLSFQWSDRLNETWLGRMQAAGQYPSQAKGKKKAYLYGQILRQAQMIL